MAYLNCSYLDDLHPSEYVIFFNSRSRGFEKSWCYVDKRDVLRIDETTGLVNVVLVPIKQDKALVAINDVVEGLSQFYVPKSEVFIGVVPRYIKN